jgi:superfamily II DNA/RNA helicase
MTFANLGLSDQLLAAVTDAGYSEPTAIQRQAIPPILMHRDIIGVAQTGTGKTASFVLPMIDILSQGRSRARMPRSLILAPTRELAAQVAENFEKYGRNHKLSMALIIGGVGFSDQDRALEKGVDVLIATPGRLIDQFERGKILMNGVGILVIDEADRMLDMGFIPDVERICAMLPPKRQTLLFSATMPGPVKKLADRFLKEPKLIEVARPASTNADIAQAIITTSSRGKRDTLRDLLRDPDLRNAIVFCNRKTTVRDLYDSLRRAGVAVGQIHGDMEQPDRIRELERFKADEIRVLVASDVAARGLDIKGVSHILNYDVPWHPDDYVHRIGRTGRAGAKGVAWTLATSDDAEALATIEKLIGQKIPRVTSRMGAGGDDAGAPAEAADAGDGRDSSRTSRAHSARPRRGARPEATAPAEVATAPAEPGSGREDSRAEPRRAQRPAPQRAQRRDEPREEKPAAGPAPARPAPALPKHGRDEPWEGPVPAFLSVGARQAA